MSIIPVKPARCVRRMLDSPEVSILYWSSFCRAKGEFYRRKRLICRFCNRLCLLLLFSLLVDDDHTRDIIVRETLTTELTATNTGRQADPSCPPYQYAEPHLPVLQIHIGMHALMQNTILLELRMHVGFVKRVKVFFGHISSKMKQCIKI